MPPPLLVAELPRSGAVAHIHSAITDTDAAVAALVTADGGVADIHIASIDIKATA